MAEAVDQIFVAAKHWLVSLAPEAWQPWVSVLLSIAALMVVFGTLFAVTTVLERKGLGRIQNRFGPNRVGPFGILQPLADGIKALVKEDIVPRVADRVVHFLAPVVMIIPPFLALAVLPFGRNMTFVEFDAAILFFFAVGASMELAVFMAGWSSRNKYSLLGAMRAIAQMISYEIPLILSSVSVIMIVGSLSPGEIVAVQAGYTNGLPNWHLLTPWGIAGFVLFMIAATAESNRSPFDLPEGESEIVAGYYIEYSGFKFALFFLGEYLGLFAVSGLGITLFLGGWHAPFAFLGFLPSWFWFFAKLFALISVFIWVRGTLPRLRQDQLMNFAWKFMLPMALVNLVAAAVWHFMAPLPVVARWVAVSLIVAGPYVMLGRELMVRKNLSKRTYRFAE
ncbi:MAG TPA: NADH-quinone oxidoreductase subunit NuoH [Verrucomicrobiota bacterium]|nr:NADH-quinone oxidoreductase subunit NuoH [Verrucomicrobiota bacterium]HPU55056.1 NADH-quinone oxidoreductase subunit NuoH [Verrucomicrobiota bacterium]